MKQLGGVPTIIPVALRLSSWSEHTPKLPDSNHIIESGLSSCRYVPYCAKLLIFRFILHGDEEKRTRTMKRWNPSAHKRFQLPPPKKKKRIETPLCPECKWSVYTCVLLFWLFDSAVHLKVKSVSEVVASSSGEMLCYSDNSWLGERNGVILHNLMIAIDCTHTSLYPGYL